MNDWREHFIAVVTGCRNEGELFSELTRLTRELDFEFCSYGLKNPLPIAAPQFILRSNYPSAWEARYVAEDYFSCDPTVAHGLTRTTPLQWAAAQQQHQQAFWEEARHYSLDHGWCLSVQGDYGTIGLLSLSRPDDPISTLELDTKEAKLIWLSQLAHSAMTGFFAQTHLPEAQKALTAREKEVLKWTAVGKTYSEISIILTIDSRTVKFHLVNAMRKLQASNKAEATVKAILLGMLF
nr:LuxR family transcriptional regulator [uncultured Pseudomonas sp.]